MCIRDRPDPASRTQHLISLRPPMFTGSACYARDLPGHFDQPMWVRSGGARASIRHADLRAGAPRRSGALSSLGAQRLKGRISLMSTMKTLPGAPASALLVRGYACEVAVFLCVVPIVLESYLPGPWWAWGASFLFLAFVLLAVGVILTFRSSARAK